MVTGGPWHGPAQPQPLVILPNFSTDTEKPEPVTGSPNPNHAKRPSRWRWWLASIAVGVIALYVLGKSATPEPKGTLLVHVTNAAGASVTSGDVRIDDVSVGRPDQRLAVRVGTVRVGMALPGWTVEPRSATVRDGVETRVDLAAKPLPVRISINSTPTSAAIAIDGRSVGRTPLSLDLVPRPYRLVATLEGYVNKTVDLMLEPASPQALRIDLATIAPPPATVAPPPAVAIPPHFTAAPFENGVTTSALPLYSNPSRNGNLVTMVSPDTEVVVLGRAEAEESWLQIRAAGRIGFVPAAGAVEPWEGWARRHTVTGPLQEVSPGLRATVRGAAYTLNGVKAPDNGPPSRLGVMQGALAQQLTGSVITCVPKTTTRYECKTSGSIDIGEYYILNGAAVPGDGAPGYYFESLQSARAKKKGIWAE